MTEVECRDARVRKRPFSHLYCRKRPPSIFVKKNLNEMSPRMQEMMMKMQRYDLELIGTPGKHLIFAAALSEAPVSGEHNWTGCPDARLHGISNASCVWSQDQADDRWDSKRFWARDGEHAEWMGFWILSTVLPRQGVSWVQLTDCCWSKT